MKNASKHNHGDRSHPSGDERFKAIDLTIRKFKFEKDALLEVLNSAQETFGYLSEDLLLYVSNQLKVPFSQVYGVATFYHMFSFTPLGDHNCIICTGTACHVKGSDSIVSGISDEFGITPGDTTDDGKFSLTTARCVGSCGIAPVEMLDGNVLGKETPGSMIKQIREVIDR